MVLIPVKRDHAWVVQPRHLSHNVLVVATIARLGLAFLLAAALHHSSYVALVLLGVMIAADVFDGALARRLGVDSNIRRATDSAVDMLSTHVVAISFISMHPGFFVLYIPLAMRDVAASAICCITLVRQRTLVLGGNWHKCSSLSKAALFLGMLSGHSTAAGFTAVLAWGVNFTLLMDYCGALRLMPQRNGVSIIQSRRFVCDELRGIRVLLNSSFRLLSLLAYSIHVSRGAVYRVATRP